jgi:anti-sigma regulatory factor (Ser/Thr protein kinase)
MKELSLHIIDIAQNSVRAGASEVQLSIVENIPENRLLITIEDNGKGMNKETLEKVMDPFYTSRTTRKVGLGLSLFRQAALACNGDFSVTSEENKFTIVNAEFKYDHIDRVPLGNMADTIATMIMSFGDTRLIYRHIINAKTFTFDTKEIKEVLGEEVPLASTEVVQWIREFILEGLEEIMEV